MTGMSYNISFEIEKLDFEILLKMHLVQHVVCLLENAYFKSVRLATQDASRAASRL